MMPFSAGIAHKEHNKLIVRPNEQGAGFMASGYARATGEVGVCIVTSVPGLP
jgi:acetolactate synthase-1/2/3 large subunit